MAHGTTYTELVAKLQNWLEDDDAEFTGSIDDVISLGELRLLRDLDITIFDATDTAATVGSVANVTKPSGATDTFVWDSVYYDNAGVRTWLKLRSYDFVIDHQGTTEGPPVYYAELAETTWIVSPIPDAVYSLQCRGTSRPDGLSTGTPNTWLGDNASDLLFMSCLAEAEGFLKSDDRKPMWEADYVSRLPDAKRELYPLLKARYPDMNMTPMPAPVPDGARP